MTQGSNPPNSASGSNPSGPQTAPPPPARTRKTHIMQIISDALKKLPKHLKLKKNQEIEDRNALRTVKAAQHASDPVKYPDPASDEESIITTSDAGQEPAPLAADVRKAQIRRGRKTRGGEEDTSRFTGGHHPARDEPPGGFPPLPQGPSLL
ncbi:hypothetical protein FB451DRAFT_1282720, partial [Mycena latifolia]